MGTLTRGQTYGSTETVTNTKLHNLVDLGSVTNIVNSDVDNSAAIVDTKLADITTGNKVGGTALFGLASVVAGAGRLPLANMNLGLGPSLLSIANTALLPISLTSMVHAKSFIHLASVPQDVGLWHYKTIVSSLASGGFPQYDGVTNFVGASLPSKTQVFNADGAWTAPSGVTRVKVSMCGGGGGGAGDDGSGSPQGGGGGGAEAIVSHVMAVTPGNSYTVTVGQGGSGGGAGENPGVAGGDSTFVGDTSPSNYTLTASGGGGGVNGDAGGAGGTGGSGNTTLDAASGDASAPYSYAGGDGSASAGVDKGGGGGGSYFGTGASGQDGAGLPGGIGAGGSGADRANLPGGDGGDGIVILEFGTEQ